MDTVVSQSQELADLIESHKRDWRFGRHQLINEIHKDGWTCVYWDEPTADGRSAEDLLSQRVVDQRPIRLSLEHVAILARFNDLEYLVFSIYFRDAARAGIAKSCPPAVRREVQVHYRRLGRTVTQVEINEAYLSMLARLLELGAEFTPTDLAELSAGVVDVHLL